MNIPNLTKMKVTNSDGTMHPDFFLFMSQLIHEMQTNLSNEGFGVPQQPTENINQLSNAASLGRLIYDNVTNELKININGEFKTVQTA